MCRINRSKIANVVLLCLGIFAMPSLKSMSEEDYQNLINKQMQSQNISQPVTKAAEKLVEKVTETIKEKAPTTNWTNNFLQQAGSPSGFAKLVEQYRKSYAKDKVSQSIADVFSNEEFRNSVLEQMAKGGNLEGITYLAKVAGEGSFFGSKLFTKLPKNIFKDVTPAVAEKIMQNSTIDAVKNVLSQQELKKWAASGKKIGLLRVVLDSHLWISRFNPFPGLGSVFGINPYLGRDTYNQIQDINLAVSTPNLSPSIGEWISQRPKTSATILLAGAGMLWLGYKGWNWGYNQLFGKKEEKKTVKTKTKVKEKITNLQ